GRLEGGGARWWVEGSGAGPAPGRPGSAITATASATAIQGSRRDTGRCSRLVDGGRLRLPAPVELGHEPRALGIGHLRPACDLGDAAPATEAKARCGVERADSGAGRFDHRAAPTGESSGT